MVKSMQIKTVNLQLSQLLEDLASGMTWFKRDDLGYGSIQEKYKANDVQINIIRKDPRLKDAATSTIIFNIIDDINGTEISDSKSDRDTSGTTTKTTKLSESNTTKLSSGSIQASESKTTSDTSIVNDLAAFTNL
jgi:hypothetical protein